MEQRIKRRRLRVWRVGIGSESYRVEREEAGRKTPHVNSCTQSALDKRRRY
jgi:hypothetical protein